MKFVRTALCAILVGCVVAACGSDENSGSGDAGKDSSLGGPGTTDASGDSTVNPTGDAGPDELQDAADEPTCTPEVIDCTNKCGPIRNSCSGEIKQCGGCTATAVDGGASTPMVCDTITHTCVAPKTTCVALQAECGSTKDSCGRALDCPTCPAGKECNPDTNKCADCVQVSCQDLGYECGDAWLGCGPVTNTTNCGDCSNVAGRPRCNTSFRTCEPACVPKTALELCTAAKTSRSVQCGLITDGCGGFVNCDTVAGFGCPVGQSCGRRGIANRCDVPEVPDECRIAGRNCNPSNPAKRLRSACDNSELDCGSCTAPQVCNDNGVCGPPCTLKTCGDYGNPACGTFADGCGGTMVCGGCAANQACDQTSKTCCNKKTCAGDYAGKCGTGLSDGCGGVMDCTTCNATTQKCTVDGTQGGNTASPASGTSGACCTKKTCADYVAMYGATVCGRTLTDGCGGTLNCGSCSANTYALCTVSNGAGGQRQTNAGEVGSCCTRNTCTSCTDIPDNCRATTAIIDCAGFNCGTGQVCGGATQNACCTRPTCPSVTDANSVVRQVCSSQTNACSTNACTCPSGQSCVTTLPGLSGTSACCAGKKACSNSYCGTNLPDTCGGTLPNCGCPTGQVCSSSTPGTPGTCGCPAGTPYNCTNNPPPGKTSTTCGNFSNGCGGTVTCGCSSGVCNAGACCNPVACVSTHAPGSACGSKSDSCGGSATCGACTVYPENRNTCTGAAGSQTCTCTPRLVTECAGRTGVIPDGCGSTINCGG